VPAEHPVASGQEAPPQLPVWKKALFGALVAGSVLLLAEGVCVLAGVRPVLVSEDPYVGFSSRIPLFVPRTRDGEEVLETADNRLRWFNSQRFPRVKAAGTYRIFCLGGSTTFGRPYDDRTSFCGWLRELLPVADPSRRWEVVNAGGISYASYRVAVLMEELVRYEPDLFVVYTGNNEFLERRTYGDVAELPEAVRTAGSWAARTRLFTVVRRVVDRALGRSRAAPAPRATLPGEVETILDQAVGPEAYQRDEALEAQVLRHFRFNLTRLVQIARAAPAELVLVVPASRLRGCAPFRSQHCRDGSDPALGRWEALYERARRALAQGRPAEALQAAGLAGTIDNCHAHLHDLRGRALWALGRHGEARAAFVRAREEDVCPLRTLTAMQEMVREVAAGAEVPVVDFAALAARLAEHGTPGEEVFLDHVHPTIAVNRRLAVLLLEELTRMGGVEPVETFGEAAVRRVAHRVEGGLEGRAHGFALRALAIVYGWAGKKEEAREQAARAVRRIPDDPLAHYLLAQNAQGDRRLAIRHYRRVLELDPAFRHAADAHNDLGLALAQEGQPDAALRHFRQALRIDPGHVARNNLGLALERAGRSDEAAQHYRATVERAGESARPAEALLNLGNLEVGRGRLAEAERHFREAVRANPHYAAAHANLGAALADQGRPEEAVPHLVEALRLESSYDTHMNLGDVLVRLGRRDEATEQFRRALRLRPGDAEALRAVATTTEGQP